MFSHSASHATLPTAHGATSTGTSPPAVSSLGRGGHYDPVYDGQANGAMVTQNYADSAPAGYTSPGAGGQQQTNPSTEFGGSRSGGGALFGPPQTPARPPFHAHEQPRQPQVLSVPQPQPQAPMPAAGIREDPAIRETRQKLAQLVDMLSNSYKLSPVHRRELHQYAQVPVGVLERVDIFHRCMGQALLYHQLEQFESTAFKFKEIAVILQDLETRLEETFKLTAEQQKNVRSVALSFITDPTRMEFLNLHEDVFNRCQSKAKAYNLTNTFQNPARRAVVLSATKRICSSVRNGLRTDLRDSVGLGDSKLEGAMALVPFSNRVAGKYKPDGAPSDVALDTRSVLTIKLAVLRAFALANPELIAVEEDEEDSTTQQPQGQKRKKGGKGRVKKGQDFWSKVEQHLAKLRKRFDTGDMEAPAWDSYIKGIVDADKDLFKSSANTSPLEEEPVEEPNVTFNSAAASAAALTTTVLTPLEDIMRFLS